MVYPDTIKTDERHPRWRFGQLETGCRSGGLHCCEGRLRGKKAAALVKKVLESAIANAEHNDGADIDDLKVAKIFVDEGPSMKPAG